MVERFEPEDGRPIEELLGDAKSFLSSEAVFSKEAFLTSLLLLRELYGKTRRLHGLKAAWRTLCREECIPQYDDESELDPAALLHGIRQLAGLWKNEKLLRERLEREHFAPLREDSQNAARKKREEPRRG